MHTITTIQNKIVPITEAATQAAAWKAEGKKVVFTNGVFDILHAGHVRALAQAAACGNKLILGLNTDASVKKIKGPLRPIIPQHERAFLLAALTFVDRVVLFEETTPLQLITSILPDVLVKSADYTPETIVGAKEVIANGGTVKIMPLVQGLSTTAIIDKIKKSDN